MPIFNQVFSSVFNPVFSSLEGVDGFINDFTRGEIAGSISSTRASSGSYVNTIGNIAVAGTDTPRFTNMPVSLVSKGLLIEQVRTNLITDSEDFSVAGWTKTRSTIGVNATTAPDGTSTADKLIEDSTASSTHIVEKFFSITSGLVYTQSIYVKAGERTSLQLRFTSSGTTWGASNEPRADFNISAGTVSAVTGASEGTCYAEIKAVGNGWYRCILVATCQVSSSAGVRFLLINSGNTSYTGDGSSGLYIWGVQLEANIGATSYIKTTGATATRAADVCGISDLSQINYNQTQGTLIVDFTPEITLISPYGMIAALSDKTINNRMIFEQTSLGNLRCRIVTGGTAVIAGAGMDGLVAETKYRIGLSYNTNSFLLCVNGTQYVNVTSGTPPTVNYLGIGSFHPTATDQVNGCIGRVQYLPYAATSDQLKSLTTL